MRSYCHLGRLIETTRILISSFPGLQTARFMVGEEYLFILVLTINRAFSTRAIIFISPCERGYTSEGITRGSQMTLGPSNDRQITQTILLSVLNSYMCINILHILGDGSNTQTRISERLNVSNSAVHYHLKDLHRAGLVRVQHDPKDFRMKVYTLTEAGHSVIRKYESGNLFPELTQDFESSHQSRSGPP